MGQQAPGGVMPKQVGSGSAGHFTEGHWRMFLSVISPGNKVTIKNGRIVWKPHKIYIGRYALFAVRVQNAHSQQNTVEVV